ncbi:MAG: o-succinylbenzoate synthase [Gemmatimonadota bacterium]
MKVERAVLRQVRLALAHPFESSAGVVAERHALLLTLHGEGLEGWSECVAPDTPHYTYETSGTAWQVLSEHVLPRAVGLDVTDPEAVLTAAEGVRGHPMAKATLEMAAWDMAARAGGLPLTELLGGTRTEVDVGVSLGMMPASELGDVVEGHLADGYRRVKVKIGPGHDVGVLAALRARFPDVALWADANSAYTLEDAPRLAELDGLEVGLLEEPLAPGAFVDSARLQERLATPVCLDESVSGTNDAATALALGSCRVVNLKPGRVGGFASSLRTAEILVEGGVPVWCGGMLETGIGRAHNLALASLPAFTLPGDISASRRYWRQDIVSPEFEVVDGKMAVPAGQPGLGVEVDVERIETLTVRVAEFA